MLLLGKGFDLDSAESVLKSKDGFVAVFDQRSLGVDGSKNLCSGGSREDLEPLSPDGINPVRHRSPW